MLSRGNTQRCIGTGAIGQYRHRAAIFHWKILGAGNEIANSLTVEGSFRVTATRRATNKMTDATISGRNLSIKYPTIATLYRYTYIRLYDHQLFIWRDVHWRFPTTTTDNERTIGPPFIPFRGGGHSGWLKRSWLSSIGFFLRTIFPLKWTATFDPHISETGWARRLKFCT